MAKDKFTYWTNCSPKPKRFSFVKGELMTYSYNVPVGYHEYLDFDRTIIEVINIKAKMKRSEFQGLDIDSKTEDLIKTEMGTVSFSTGEGMFQRDNCMFPFVSFIVISETDIGEFRRHRRNMKIRKLKTKIDG
jgi:hypothetical protein